jgi:Spo0E like sporulation regulatory protein
MSAQWLERIEILKKKEFLKLIEAKRIELNKIVSKNGLNSKVTLEYSQQLDKLLNQYNQLLDKANSNFYYY